MNARLRGAIGLSMKAGKCESGDFAVEKAVSRGKIRLLILDSSASELTREKYENDAERLGIPLMYVDDAGEAIGKPARKILGITDDNFKKMILGAQAQE